MSANPENTPENDPLSPEPLAEEQAAEEQASGNETDAPEADAQQAADAYGSAPEDETAKLKDQLIRALADAENTRKRAVKERQDATKYAVSKFAKELLSVADNLRRALEAVPEDLLDSEPRVKNLVDGVAATERALLKSFELNGIEKIEAAEAVFDPHIHEVMFEAPGTGKPAGTIIQTVEPGYMIHDRLLRPARVGVAKDDGQGNAPGSEAPSGPGGQIDQEV